MGVNVSPSLASLKNMKLYHLDITIHNDHGELLDTRRSFTGIHELNAFMTDSSKMHELWCEAEENGKRDMMLYEELVDGADYKTHIIDLDEEDISPTSPLNNPANFAN